MKLRSMTPQERIYAYQQPTQLLSRVGGLGYLHGDFGKSGKEFHETWFSFDDQSQSETLRKELDTVLDQLRTRNPKLLGGLEEMRRNVKRYQKSKFEGNYCTEYGFRIDAETHTFMLRCIPVEMDYQFYVFAYLKRLLDGHMQKAENGIQFLGPNFKPAFSVKDGDKIVMVTGGDTKVRVCRYINESHILVGDTVFHIDEFTEVCKEDGTRYFPKASQR